MDPANPEFIAGLFGLARELIHAAKESGPAGVASLLIGISLFGSAVVMSVFSKRIAEAWRHARELKVTAREEELSARLAALERERAEERGLIRQLHDWLVERQHIAEMIIKALPEDTDFDIPSLRKAFEPPPLPGQCSPCATAPQPELKK
ncbi:MAG TPA: hypothetical protein VEB64_04115 [Azospirillaceae bacterium]|nr:hypothetical protein [Azospirillaceae bacterium]